MVKQSIGLESTPTVGVLNVPDNGGHCVSINSDGLTVYLPGYGEAAAKAAFDLAQSLINAAQSIMQEQPEVNVMDVTV